MRQIATRLAAARMFFVTSFALSIVAANSLAQEAKAEVAAVKKADVKKAKVARMTLSGSFPESAGAMGLFGDIEPNLRDVVSRLDQAAGDKEISAVVLRFDNPSIGRGKLEELRAAIARARSGGKKIVAELSSAMSGDYLLACACDEIVMPESGTLMIPGIRAEISFYGGLFEKLGIEADMMQVGSFKGAAEPYTRKNMSPEFRQQYEQLIDDFYQQMTAMIAADRHLEKAKVNELIDIGLFSARDAKEAGLIDTVAYDDETKARLTTELKVDQVEMITNYGKQELDTDFSGMMGFIKLFEMMMGGEPAARVSKNKKIALVYAVGPIMTGSSGVSMFGAETVGSDTIVKALRKADEDQTVVAIVLRIDSPGGSALASDLMWREIVNIEKPMIASMGDVAASGGYYIAMGCDQIFAEPGTITGSIGVVGGKIATNSLFDKVGITTDVISRGQNSGLLSGSDKFTDSERVVWKKMMEETYAQFTAKAAAGRKMEMDKLETLAGGRIWSGVRAKEIGLVDELGTLRDAIKAAKKLGGMTDEDKAELLILPEPTNFLDQLLGVSAMAPKVKAELDRLSLVATRHFGDAAIIQRLFAEPGVLVMPYRVEIK